MAQPFGGHPTLGDYIVWAQSIGCTVNQGYTNTQTGSPYSLTRIISPDREKWVIDVGTQHSDYLVPTTVARYDRRLGVKSPFFSLDDADYERSD